MGATFHRMRAVTSCRFWFRMVGGVLVHNQSTFSQCVKIHSLGIRKERSSWRPPLRMQIRVSSTSFGCYPGSCRCCGPSSRCHYSSRLAVPGEVPRLTSSLASNCIHLLTFNWLVSTILLHDFHVWIALSYNCTRINAWRYPPGLQKGKPWRLEATPLIPHAAREWTYCVESRKLCFAIYDLVIHFGLGHKRKDMITGVESHWNKASKSYNSKSRWSRWVHVASWESWSMIWQFYFSNTLRKYPA